MRSPESSPGSTRSSTGGRSPIASHTVGARSRPIPCTAAVAINRLAKETELAPQEGQAAPGARPRPIPCTAARAQNTVA